MDVQEVVLYPYDLSRHNRGTGSQHKLVIEWAIPGHLLLDLLFLLLFG